MSVVGRKIVRKIVYSFIECRRRLKMNEEFVVFKSLILVCIGEMYKLVIL